MKTSRHKLLRSIYMAIAVVWLILGLGTHSVSGFRPKDQASVTRPSPAGEVGDTHDDEETHDNRAPVVDAGPDLTVSLPGPVFLDANVSDDGLPSGDTEGQVFLPILMQSIGSENAGAHGRSQTTLDSSVVIERVGETGSAENVPAADAQTHGVTLRWTQVEGPEAAWFEAPTHEDTAVTFSTAGEYRLRLTASDGELEASDDVIVTVKASASDNQAPTVDAGADMTLILPSELAIDATVTDDGLPGPLRIQWTQVEGPEAGPSAVVFSFGAAGDHDATENTAAVLQALHESDAEFFLSLGDLSYTKKEPESVWCDFVKSYVGPEYPFELLVGNHEEQLDKDGFIDKYAECLPDRLGVNGLYAHRYYFDYPAAAPIARFILIDPNLYRGKSIAEYCKDGERENCEWLTTLIDEAAQQGLWTIVGMHKNCITAGVKRCEIGAELLDVLVSKRVDLILQGHEHIYERSKQLALTETCPAIETQQYDAACVADDGSDGEYLAGAGPTLVIVGVSGRELGDIPGGDLEAPYFATMMGANENPSYGFMKFDLSTCAIDAQFVNAVGQYQDSFVIKKPASDYPDCVQTTEAMAAIQSPNSEDTVVTFPSVGEYRLRLTAYDGEFEASDDVTVTVVASPPVNQTPRVDVGADVTVTLPDGLTLDATISDDGLPGGPLTVAWSQTYGPDNAIFAAPNHVDTDVAFPVSGAYELRLTASDGEFEGSDSLVVTVLEEGGSGEIIAIEVAVAGGSDDAEESSTGRVDLTNSDLELVYDSGSKETQVVGIRFANLDIPQGAAILNAYIQFTADETDSKAVDLLIVAEDADDSRPFKSKSKHISNRDRTTASVRWQPAAWDKIGEQKADQRTPDLATLFQAVVDRPAWQANNAAAIIITGSGKRVAVAYDGDQSAAAVLHIEFQVNGP